MMSDISVESMSDVERPAGRDRFRVMLRLRGEEGYQ